MSGRGRPPAARRRADAPGRMLRRGAARLACLGAAALVSGCCTMRPWSPPPGLDGWQPPEPPRRSLAEKARFYQARIEQAHRLPDGLIRYKRIAAREATTGGHGDLADGAFFLGLHLASQAFRHAATGDPRARREIEQDLRGLELLFSVTGRPGLLARHVAPAAPTGTDPRWRPSPTHPGLYWRSDVSKDQVAGVVHGLGTTLALVEDPAIRARVAALSGALADHLIEHDLRLVDWDGVRTTHGDLRGRIAGVPIGVNALISLAVARVAATATGLPRHRAFHRRLLDEGYAGLAYWAHVSIFGVGNRDNDHMAYLALDPLLRLERDPDVIAALRRSGQRSWRHVARDGNALFAFEHAALVAPQPEDPGHAEAVAIGRTALLEFPDEKIARPTDLTASTFGFRRSWWHADGCAPRSAERVPVYLRPRASSMWTGDPYRLVGRLRARGEMELAGIDYLQAYWLGRLHGFVSPQE